MKKKPASESLPPWEISKGLNLSVASEAEGRKCAAETFTDPALAAAHVITSATHPTEKGLLDINDLLASLRSHASAVSGGDMSRVEALLFSQSEAMQALFVRLSTRAMTCTEVTGFDANMKMALRAQSQCRATLETLATIKNPPVVFAKQANISHGHQQVNNGEAVPVARAESEITPIKQLETPNARPEWMDARAANATGRGNPTLEAVVQVNRAKNRRR